MRAPDTDPAAAVERQFVSFELAGERFAVPMAPVQEIIRLPAVARLPLAPPGLLGLANLRGRVLPLFSLRRLLDLPEPAEQDSARAIVIQGEQPLGFTVDRVSSVLQVDEAELHPVRSLRAVVPADCLSGLIRRARPEGDELLMVLDVERLVQQQLAQAQQAQRAQAALAAPAAGPAAALAPTGNAEAGTRELRLVSFTSAGQEYALPIEAVQEIVQLPEQVTALPQAPADVRGVISLRQRLLPLIDLRRRFGLPDGDPALHPRVVVLSQPGQEPVGLITDAVKEVMGVPTAWVDPVPGPLRDGDAGGDLAAICRLDEGRRLVSLLAVERLIGSPLVDLGDALAPPPSAPESPMNAPLSAGPATELDDAQWVVFRLGDEEFGVPIMVVQEIVRVPAQLTRVPCSPAFVEGVINLRGTVLPVVDQRRRLGLPPIERNDRQRIMVLSHEQQRTGFIVDAVAEVLRVPAQSLQPAPDIDAGPRPLIRQVAHLPGGRLVQRVEPQELMRLRSEREALATA